MRDKPLVRVGIDLMGSELPPEALILAAESAASISQNVELVLFGEPSLAFHTRLSYVKCTQVIEMDDHPLMAIRRKRESSICIGLKKLQEGAIDAFVSAGNTGALVFGAKTILSMVKGFLRPALCALMPTQKKLLAVLDVGANVKCKAIHLVQFALLGIALQKVHGIAVPSVGLLNIGSEAMKGTSELRLAYQKLQQLASAHKSLFRFVGNTEGTSVFDGNIDVLITDGFTGNIFLKTAEGITSLILDRLNQHLSDQIVHQIGTELRDLSKHLHYAEYPGALLCGVRGIVIKCHGYSSQKAFTNGILSAEQLVRQGFFQDLQNQLVTNSFSK